MRQADAPLIKITTRFYKADIEFIQERYGAGYQELMRQWIKQKCDELRKEND